MNSDPNPNAPADPGDKFATTKQRSASGAPVALQLRSASFPIAFGRYELSRVLGEGTMGAVYLGKDTQLGRDVAIKVPKFDRTDRGAIERFQREARAMATLRHANLCPVYDVGEIEGIQYFTMAYIEGKTLDTHLEAGKTLAPRDVALLMLKLALAAEEAHQQGIVHRDLKPANIIIDHNKEPIVMDFGLARLAEATSSLTQAGLMLGTPAYMAPEQVRGELKSICPASDVYSLGAMMYEMLTGRLAFEGSVKTVVERTLAAEPDPPSQFAPGVDPQLDSICLQAMAKEPRDRYKSGGELAKALREYLKRPRQVAPIPLIPVAEPDPVDQTHATQTLTDVSATTFTAPLPVTKIIRPKRKPRRERIPTWLVWATALPTIAVLILIVVLVIGGDDDPDVVADKRPTAEPSRSAAELVATKSVEDGDTSNSADPVVEPAAKGPSTTVVEAPSVAEPTGREDARPFVGPPGDGVPIPPPPRDASQIMSDLDRNQDGLLQITEIPQQDRPHLQRADADKSGSIDQEELEVFLVLYPPRLPPR